MGEDVAPFAGAWIEIEKCMAFQSGGKVAPFAGAWIEIGSQELAMALFTVAPFAGAWIEIRTSKFYDDGKKSRSLRGSVD